MKFNFFTQKLASCRVLFASVLMLLSFVSGVNAQIVVQNITKTNATNCGANNGSISINSTGSTNGGGVCYFLRIENDLNQTVFSFSTPGIISSTATLPPGNYTITGQVYNCISLVVLDVRVNTVTIGVTPDAVACLGGSPTAPGLNLTAAAWAACNQTIGASDFLVANCSNIDDAAYTVSVMSLNDALLATSAPAGGRVTVPSSQIGKVFKVVVTKISNGTNCWGYARLEDKDAPVCNGTLTLQRTIACTDAIPAAVTSGSFNDCSAYSQWNLEGVLDNGCTVLTALPASIGGITLPGGLTLPANITKVIVRAYYAKDVWGNTSTVPCYEVIYIQRNPITIYVDDMVLNCGAAGVPTYASALTGSTTLLSPAAINALVAASFASRTVGEGKIGGGVNNNTFDAANAIGQAYARGLTSPTAKGFPFIEVKSGLGYNGIDKQLDGTGGDASVCLWSDATFTDMVMPGSCANNFMIMRTWKISSGCNEVVTLVQIIRVEDKVAPTATGTYSDFSTTTENFCVGTTATTVSRNILTELRRTANTLSTVSTTPTNIYPRADANMCNTAGVSLILSVNETGCSGVRTVTVSDSRLSVSGSPISASATLPASVTISGTIMSTTPVPVSITLEDECGNRTVYYIRINIVDNVSPSVVCKEFTKVTLNDAGQARLFSASLDNNSTDNCGIESFYVRRMTNAVDNSCGATQVENTGCWMNQLDFTCGDLNDPNLTVSLRVRDYAGNTSDCMVNVTVEDKTGPRCVTDLQTTSVSCTSSDIAGIMNNTAGANYGFATAYDNCGVTLSGPVNQRMQNDCGAGSIIRTWTATDCANATSQCSVTIAITGRTTITIVPVRNRTVNCGTTVNSQKNGLLANITTALAGTCGKYVVYVDSAVYMNGSCMKWVYTYKVVDCCSISLNDALAAATNYNGPIPQFLEGSTDNFVINTVSSISSPSVNGNGFYVFQQVVLVRPTATQLVTGDITVTYPAGACSGTITATLKACNSTTINYLYNWKLYAGTSTAGTLVTQGQGSSVSVSGLAMGTYFLDFNVSDGCLTSTNAAGIAIVLSDNQAPTINLLNKVVELGGATNAATGVLGLWEIWNNAVDNCTSSEILFRNAVMEKGSSTAAAPAAGLGTSVTYSCADGNSTGAKFPATRTVTVWTKDAAGNWNKAYSTITVQDNLGLCTTPEAFVSGAARTENNAVVNNVTVSTSVNGAAVASATVVNGSFNISMAPAANVQVRAAKNNNDDAMQGVTTFDIAKMSQHILDIEKFASPYQLIAADVDKSNEIDATDMLHTRRAILKITPSLPGGNFRFIDKAYTFRNAANPFGEDFPEVVNIANLTTNTAANFIAVKLGDVNGSYSALAPRSSRTLSFLANDMAVVAGNEYTVNISADKLDAAAFQGTFSFNGATVKSVKAGNLNNMTDGNIGIFANAVTTSWNGKTQDASDVLAITFVANKSGKLSDMLTVNSALTQAIANDVAGNEMNVNLKFNTGKVAGGEFALYQNQPNPVANETTIGFNLPKDGQARLTITAVDGKVVQVINGNYKAGYNTVTVNKSDLKASGVFYYRLETADHSASKKMVIIE